MSIMTDTEMIILISQLFSVLTPFQSFLASLLLNCDLDSLQLIRMTVIISLASATASGHYTFRGMHWMSTKSATGINNLFGSKSYQSKYVQELY